MLYGSGSKKPYIAMHIMLTQPVLIPRHHILMLLPMRIHPTHMHQYIWARRRLLVV